MISTTELAELRRLLDSYSFRSDECGYVSGKALWLLDEIEFLRGVVEVNAPQRPYSEGMLVRTPPGGVWINWCYGVYYIAGVGKYPDLWSALEAARKMAETNGGVAPMRRIDRGYQPDPANGPTKPTKMPRGGSEIETK